MEQFRQCDPAEIGAILDKLDALSIDELRDYQHRRQKIEKHGNVEQFRQFRSENTICAKITLHASIEWC